MLDNVMESVKITEKNGYGLCSSDSIFKFDVVTTNTATLSTENRSSTHQQCHVYLTIAMT